MMRLVFSLEVTALTVIIVIRWLPSFSSVQSTEYKNEKLLLAYGYTKSQLNAMTLEKLFWKTGTNMSTNISFVIYYSLFKAYLLYL